MKLRAALWLMACAAALAAAPAVRAAQTPVPTARAAAGFVQQEVTYPSANGKVRLAGTLTLPVGPGPFPAVVLVVGSGPATRSQPIGGQEAMAEDLARHGIAALRYDKRGLGASTGDFNTATTFDLADDAAAGVVFLRGAARIDGRRVGLIGHSEGGLIGPIVAARDPKLSFLVMIAAPAVNGGDILVEQGRLYTETLGLDAARVEEARKLRGQMIEIIRTEKDANAAKPRLDQLNDALVKVLGAPDKMVGAKLFALNTDWGRFFITYDPVATLAKVRCPVLAINGAEDVQVPANQNLPLILSALKDNPDVVIRKVPGVGHNLMKGGGSGPKPGATATIDPDIVSTVTTWVVKHAKP